ncbi:glycosyltransferase family 2 protein [Candidatus Saccharibacteria bacterium]|nr:glycosyltransferase family 2 protein [Candidatus Saccharibacteria bacterium]MBI3338335.1 glycosyltransferase family 2 protein [Candidatus Saccharibacteria bacterium]
MIKKNSLTLSIVIPVYNEEHHLKACLDSIAAQIEQPDEVIVIDNNSVDKTVEIAKGYGFVTLLKEPKQGVVFARNRGFDAVTSDIIGRIDADSILPPDWTYYVKHFYAENSHNDEALTGGCYFYNMRLARFQGWCQAQIAFRFNRFILGHYILFGSNMAIPKTMWSDIRHSLCHDNGVHEDLDLAIHAYKAGYKITYRSGLKVGVKMRRVRSQRDQLWSNLMWWPKTLRRHDRWTWIIGWIGAVFLYAISIGGPLIEHISRFFGYSPINE